MPTLISFHNVHMWKSKPLRVFPSRGQEYSTLGKCWTARKKSVHMNYLITSVDTYWTAKFSPNKFKSYLLNQAKQKLPKHRDHNITCL